MITMGPSISLVAVFVGKLVDLLGFITLNKQYFMQMVPLKHQSKNEYDQELEKPIYLKAKTL